MPLQYDVDHAARRVTVIWTEPVELAEIIDLLERQAADGAWAYSVLHDTRLVTDASDRARMPAVAKAAQRLSETYGRRGPTAIVAALPRVGVTQRYAIRVQGTQDIEVFWSRDDAERWLDAQRDIRSA